MAALGHCPGCGEACEERQITVTLPRASTGIAVFKNVPAEVCPACGESGFSVQTAGKIMAVVRANNPPDEMAHIPVFDLDKQCAY